MALQTLLIKKIPEAFKNIETVYSTSDLKIISVHDKNQKLLVFSVRSQSNVLTLSGVKSFAWQEDNYSQEEYHLLIVNNQNEILYYVIELKLLKEKAAFLSDKVLSKWNLVNIFQYFQELAKKLATVSVIEILKFESKEVVLVFDNKTVVSFFPSSKNDPQIMSISDLSEDKIAYRKIVLMKELLFALDAAGEELAVYSFTNNTKIYELKFSDSKTRDIGTICHFTVSLKLDLLLVVNEDRQVFSMPLCLPSPAVPPSNRGQSPGIVTAFTKQYPSVRGLDNGLRRHSNPRNFVKTIAFGFDVGGELLRDLILLEDKLCFTCCSDARTVVGVHLLDRDESAILSVLPPSSFIVKGGSEEIPFPLLLLSENKLLLLLYDTEQDKLVNELMIYPSSGAVETLASLNSWTNIHMDIEVLRLGLSNRKIYTVQFYLKTLFEGFCQQWNASVSENWLEKVKKECSIWSKILHMVLANIKENLNDSFSCQYAQQLLQIVISMVIQILDVVQTKTTNDYLFLDGEKTSILKTFSSFLLEMRKLLREEDASASETAPDVEDVSGKRGKFNITLLSQWRKWENLDYEDIIQDSLLNGTIPMAQSYFFNFDENRALCSFKYFETASEHFIYSYLRQGLMEETLTVLLNMGMSVNSKLLEIYKSTPEKDIRSLLSGELQKRELLSEKDAEILQFVSLLENLYPCTSFEHARLLLNEKCSVLETEMNCAVPEKDESLPVGDFMPFNLDNSESGAYCRIIVDWLETWDDDIESRILSPQILKNYPVLDFFFAKEGKHIEINPVSVWYYLLENGNLPYLTNWVEVWLGIRPRSSDGFSLWEKWPLNEMMINAIPDKAPTHVSETLLNILARFGIFCEEELEDISLFLTRVGHSQCDIYNMETFASDRASLSFSDLCHRLVHYCLKHRLIHFLYTFLSRNLDKFTSWPLCRLCDVPLLKLTKTYCSWSQNPQSAQLAYDAIVGTAQYIYKLPSTSAVELFTNVPVPLAIGTSLFKSRSLSETISEIQRCSPVLVDRVKEKFQPYPVLYNYLFKSEEERSECDVTVYDLLKGSTVFDTTQLFGWQSANTLKSEDAQNVLPHFSLASLSEQHGLKKELTYLYYLMEGRPNYAYLKFVAQEVVIDSGLSLSRVLATCRDVTDYALSNYRNAQISAACISFIELLGQDSLPLRVCLVAANMLHEHQASDHDGSHLEIGRKLKQAHLNKDVAMILISELETVILNKWNSFSTEPTAIFQDIILWMPVMSLAHLYEVDAGRAYLEECAKQNSWLKFLVFAQVFQVAKETVLKSASKFSSSCIYYHIFHALHRKPSLIYDVVYETKSAPSVKAPRKDMRKSLYSRIGVLQGTNAPMPENKKPVDQDDDKCSVSSEETVSSTDADLKSFVLKDLFSQLLLAHNSDTPDECLLHTSRETKNATLALLAASYPDSILENCFFTWLYTTLIRDEALEKILESSFNQKILVPNVEDVEKLILIAVHNKKILILYEGVICFLPSTPLVPLMEFLKKFILYKRFDASIEQFQNQLWNYNKNTESSSVLLSLSWIENISVSVLKEAVIGCSTSYEQLILLRHYSHTRLEKSFSKEVVVPLFIKVCKMMEHLGDVARNVHVEKFLLSEDDVEYGEECWAAVKQLLDRHRYDDAQLFGNVAKLNSEKMILLQMNQESEEARKSENWGNLLHRVEFWSQLIQRLSASSVTVHATVEFLENQCEISNMFGEKYFLMKSVVEYLNHIFEKTGFYDTKAHNIEAYRKKMWWFCIKAEVNGELLPEIFDMQPLHEFNVLDVMQDSENGMHRLEGEKENQALCNIIGYFLCSKNIRKALELARIFDYDSSDINIIKKCLQLANDEIDVSSVDISLPDSSTEVASSRLISSLVLWICSDSGVTQTQKDVIKLMEQLSMKSAAVVAICHQILVNYSIAMVLSKSYPRVSEEKEPLRTLKQVLHKKLSDNFLLARSFIAVNELPDREVAKFLGREIWNSLQILSGPSSGVLVPEEKSAFSEELIYDPLQTQEGFQLIVKLCQDSSVLGNSLMDIFSEETVDLSPKTPDKFFSSVVELCICAHECYTAACNMDGISKILHNSQLLVNMLEEGKKFNIMIRLLIGLGRYGEMMYVFDILKAHDKFQLLFEANINNASSLRLALQDYLKRSAPSNSDSFSYTLAKRFGMHREKAESLEMSVQKILSRLCKRNTDIDLRKELEDAEQNLSEAAISYCKADCFNQARHCARLAKLVALQIYFLSSGIWIVGLDDASVCRFITDHDDFAQSLIVAEEYGKDNSWEQALLNNFIIRGDREYLRAFQAHMDIKSSTIRNIAKKFQLLPNKNESLTKNMKHLLGLCPDTRTKFILAKDLGFKDIITELKMKEGSYVRDLFPEDVR